MSRSLAVILTVVLFALLNTGNAHVTRVFKCPCSFSVSRAVFPATDGEAFDVLVLPFASFDRTPNAAERNVIEEHSSRNLRISDAVHTSSGYHSFKIMTIEEKGLFRVAIRHHTTRAAAPDPEYNLKLHTSAKQVICPVILQPDPPRPATGRMLNTGQSQKSAIRQNSRDPRIVGGLFISPSLQRYLVAIQIPTTCSDGSSGCATSCTGTILSKRWIMTAAHCEVTPGSRILINSVINRFGASTSVRRVFNNPAYFPAFFLFNDIAVLETTDDMDTCCDVEPKFMPINTRPSFPRAGSFVRAAGYGIVSEDRSVPESVPGLLRQVDVPIVAFSRCRSAYGSILEEDLELCAGYFEDGGCDSCRGDSGGPLVQYSTDGTPVLVGVTSFGAGCARPEAPGVYEKPSAHLDFLDRAGADYTKFSGRLSTVRVRCKAGEYLPYIRGEVSECTPCPDDEISKGGTTRECQKCPNTMLRDPTRGGRCSCRARAGFGRVVRSGRARNRCRRCTSGRFSGVGDEKCVKCAAGSYAPKRGMSECLPCPGARRGARTCKFEEPMPTETA